VETTAEDAEDRAGDGAVEGITEERGVADGMEAEVAGMFQNVPTISVSDESAGVGYGAGAADRAGAGRS
jgi:hypothetical protein